MTSSLAPHTSKTEGHRGVALHGIYRRVESALLSDHGLFIKRGATWVLLLVTIAYSALGVDWHFPPGLLDYTQNPVAFDGAPLVFHTSVLHHVQQGEGTLVRSALMWVPVEGPLEPYSSWEQRCLSGRWTSRGTIVVEKTLPHSRRPLKRRTSLVTSVVLLAAFIMQYRPRKA